MFSEDHMKGGGSREDFILLGTYYGPAICLHTSANSSSYCLVVIIIIITILKKRSSDLRDLAANDRAELHLHWARFQGPSCPSPPPSPHLPLRHGNTLNVNSAQASSSTFFREIQLFSIVPRDN